MMHMSDIVIPPDTIYVLLKSFKKVPNAGWIGGILHHRFPFQREIQEEDPLNYGLLGPWLKVSLRKHENMRKVLRKKETSLITAIGKEKTPCEDWLHVWSTIHDYGLGQPTEESILKWQEDGLDILTNCISTGHCWMVPPEIIKKKIHMKIDNTEASVVFAKKLWAINYTMCCNTRLYFEHISVDGKIYRHALKEPLTKEEKKYAKKLTDSNNDPAETLKKLALTYSAMLRNKVILERKRKEAKKLKELEEREEPKIEDIIKPKIESVIPPEVEVVIPPKIEDIIEPIDEAAVRKACIIFLASNLPSFEPPKRPESNCLVFDNIYRKTLSQKDWDELYGKWVVFLNNDTERKKCMREAKILREKILQGETS